MNNTTPLADELELSDYIRILRRRWIWPAFTTTVIVALAAAFSVNQVPTFSSTAQVSLGHSAAQNAVNVGGLSYYQSERQLSNEVNLAMADQVRSEVADRLGYLPAVRIIADEESDILRFSSRSPTATQAATDANTWAQAYVDIKREDAGASLSQAISLFEDDLKQIRQQRQTIRKPLDELQDQLLRTSAGPERDVLQIQVDRTSADLAPELLLLDSRLNAVTNNLTELELTLRLANTGTARIVQVAAPPQLPTNPGVTRNLVLAGVVGLILGAAAALLADNLDRSIKSAEDVTAMGFPVLGDIPYTKAAKGEELALHTLQDPGSALAEAFQKTRTSTEFALLGRRLNSLLITSPGESEGKTTVAANLASAMNSVDHRVALVDTDFRRPRVHKVFQTPLAPGLSNALISHTPLSQTALRVDRGAGHNLIVIPAGTRPPNPAGFVSSKAFTELIGTIQAEADLVILDAPPVLPVSDALSLGRAVDAIIIVAKVGKTTRDQLAQAIESLRQAGGEPLGVCLLGRKRKRSERSKYYEDDEDNPGSQMGPVPITDETNLRRNSANQAQVDLTSVPAHR